MAGPLKHEPTGRSEAIQAKSTLALQLRMAGMTWHTVAAQIKQRLGVNCSHEAARRYVKKSLVQLAKQEKELASEYRQLQLERYHRMLLKCWAQVERGNQKVKEYRPSAEMQQLIDEEMDRLKTALTDDDIEKSRARLKKILFEPVEEKSDEFEGSQRHLAAMAMAVQIMDRINSIMGLDASATLIPPNADPMDDGDVITVRVNGNVDRHDPDLAPIFDAADKERLALGSGSK